MKKRILALSLLSSIVNADSMTIELNNQLRLVEYSKQNQYAIAEGDIIIADLSRPSAVVIPKVGGKRWPNGLVPIKVDAALPMKNKVAVYQAMLEWEEKSHLEFVEINENNASKYQDYIKFIPAAGTTCSSWVGRQQGEQTIRLAPRCNKGNTIHEIGHALGLWHEQSRSDRHNYIQIIWDNIVDEHKHNFNQHLSDGKDFGYYDYNSIMHYSPFAFSKNGEKTIISLQDGAEKMGQRQQLSEQDIAAVNTMYPQF